MNDHFYMNYALTLAEKAATLDEVPVGSIVVLNNEIIGEGYNQPISSTDPTAHAEIIALRNAAKRVGNYRLPENNALCHLRTLLDVYWCHDSRAGATPCLWSERFKRNGRLCSGPFNYIHFIQSSDRSD